MKITNYKKEVSLLVKWAKKASKIIKHGKMQVMDKGTKNDLVTNLDIAVEKYLLEKFKKHFPELSPVTEEFNSKAELKADAFVIDPIDGTINFANGIAMWAIQMAIIRNSEIVASVVYLPVSNEMFVAAQGEGAYLNGKRIHVNNVPIGKCVYTIDGGSGNNKGKMIEDLKPHTRQHRSLGSAAVSFAYVAKGALGATAFLRYAYWDFIPGLLLVQEAGASVYKDEGNYIMATNNNETLALFKKVIADNYTYKNKK